MRFAGFAFARGGDPNHAGLQAWPKYDAASRTTMEMGTPCRVVNDPEPAERSVWDGIPFDGIPPPGAAQVAVFPPANSE